MKRISTAFRNLLAQGGGWADALGNGRMKAYTGAQPASPDTAPSGTLLATFTKNGGAFTAEVRATATILLAGASGSADSLTVAGIPLIHAAVPFTTDINTTAAALATAINAARIIHGFTATAASATVTLRAPRNTGAYFNGLPIVFSGTTITGQINGGSSTALGGTGATAGVTAVNGLNFAVPAAGVVSKEAGTTWSGVAVATGQVGWIRFEGDGDDTGATGTDFIRFDCSVGTSGADINITNTLMNEDAVQTFSPYSLAIPELQNVA